MYPLFGGPDRPSRTSSSAPPKPPTLSALAHLLFLVKFYTDLPSFDTHRSAVAATCRSVQLWLRDATANDLTAFLRADTTLLPSDARTALLTILQTLQGQGPGSGSGSGQGQDRKRQQSSEASAGSVKPFSHPYYWGAFAVSGHGGAVTAAPTEEQVSAVQCRDSD